MPEMNLIELLRQARNSSQNAMRILLTAHGDLNVAIEAINEADVYKFITKPWNNHDLLLTAQRALEHYNLIMQNQAFADTQELMVDENTEEIGRLREALREMATKICALTS